MSINAISRTGKRCSDKVKSQIKTKLLQKTSKSDLKQNYQSWQHHIRLQKPDISLNTGNKPILAQLGEQVSACRQINTKWGGVNILL